MSATRFFDFVFSFLGLIILSPIIVLIAALIKVSSKGDVFYRQKRVGIYGRDFQLYKFRSMFTNADKKGLLTVGGKDSRITRVGAYLRKYKLDELPQLLNVLQGNMSLVGPRPEVRKYVDLYTEEQRKVLSVLPGITDYASIAFRNENELLGNAADPEALYVQEVMPEKIRLNFAYINHPGLKAYFEIIFKTIYTSIKG